MSFEIHSQSNFTIINAIQALTNDYVFRSGTFLCTIFRNFQSRLLKEIEKFDDSSFWKFTEKLASERGCGKSTALKKKSENSEFRDL